MCELCHLDVTAMTVLAQQHLSPALSDVPTKGRLRSTLQIKTLQRKL